MSYIKRNKNNLLNNLVHFMILLKQYDNNLKNDKNQ